MDNVKRYGHIGYLVNASERMLELYPDMMTVYVKAADFDRVTAERDALQQRLTAANERADVLEGLLLQTNELLYAIQGDPGAVLSSSIDAMRGEVFTALKPAQEQPKP